MQVHIGRLIGLQRQENSSSRQLTQLIILMLVLMIQSAHGADTEIITPTPNATLNSTMAVFEWVDTGAFFHAIKVGTAKGKSDIFYKLYAGSGNTRYYKGSNKAIVGNLPNDGSTIYVSMVTQYGSYPNSSWEYDDYTYTSATNAPRGMISPADGETLTGKEVTFHWEDMGAEKYSLSIGSQPRRSDLLQAYSYVLGSATSHVAHYLPTDGAPVYVSLGRYIESRWVYEYFAYTAYTDPQNPQSIMDPAPAQITSHVPGMMLEGSTVNFQWEQLNDALMYYLYIGSKPGGTDLHWQILGSKYQNSTTVEGLPTDGSPVYVTLATSLKRTPEGSYGWYANEYTYTAFSSTQADALSVQINNPETLVTVPVSPVEVSGVINIPKTMSNGVLTVNGVEVPHVNGAFTTSVALEEGLNTVVARVVTDAAEVTDSITLSLDATPPYITIDNVENGAEVYQNSISLTGLVNDIVRGTISENEANISVHNSATGDTEVAVVSNRTYHAADVDLAEGNNIITVTASDAAGNINEKTINVLYQTPGNKRIELVSGQHQRAQVRTQLAQPLVVKLLDEKGNPVADKHVVFRVAQGDGVLAVGQINEAQGVVVRTDANGQASTTFLLGGRAGVANHRVRAKAVGYEGEVLFYVSGIARPADKVGLIAGDGQRGAINQPLPQPLIVAATDEGANLIPGAQIEFRVGEGGGYLVDPKTKNEGEAITVTTDSDGRALVEYVLGSVVGVGKHRVAAQLLGSEAVVGFGATAVVPGDPGLTTITGIVVDTNDKPLPGVAVRIEAEPPREAFTNAAGHFTITEVPVGPVHLIADGSTTSVAGEWPTLSYNMVTIAGVENPLISPIYMTKLDTGNAVTVGDKDIEYTVPEMPGFKLTVKKGSVTFPDGSTEGDISVTAVNANKVPMVPPNGMQPQFIVTIQPAGAVFDPPAPLSIPNTDGHKPGAQVEMYSYDHDLEEFVTIGLGTVSADGQTIDSNPGVGVVKAGWHCGSVPGGSGCCGSTGRGSCPICQKSEGGSCGNGDCVNDDEQKPGPCKECSGGELINLDGEIPGEQCFACKQGKPLTKDFNENPVEENKCDDKKFCTNYTGEFPVDGEPSFDACINGSCKGKEIKPKKLENIMDPIEAEPAKQKIEEIKKAFKKGSKLMADLAKAQPSGDSSGKSDPYNQMKFKFESYKAQECCEDDKKFVMPIVSKASGSIEAGWGFKTPDIVIAAAGPVPVLTVYAAGKISTGASASITYKDEVCTGKCNLQGSGSVFTKVEGEVGLGVIHSAILSFAGVATFTGSLSVVATEDCSFEKKLCAGPLVIRGMVKTLGFGFQVAGGPVPNSQDCADL